MGVAPWPAPGAQHWLSSVGVLCTEGWVHLLRARQKEHLEKETATFSMGWEGSGAVETSLQQTAKCKNRKFLNSRHYRSE